MPKEVEERITRQYERRGYSHREARRIAIAIMVDNGIYKPRHHKRKRRGRLRGKR